MNKKLDLDRLLETKNEYPVRLICSDAKGFKPIIVLIGNNKHLRTYHESVRRVTLEGRYFLDRESSYDIVNKKTKQTVYINMYPIGNSPWVHSSRKDADRGAALNRIACKEVVITEGEGLDE